MTRVALFPTCLVELTAARVGFATMAVLERLGIRAEVPEAGFCCGQPAFNSGFHEEARQLAEDTVAALQPYDVVLVPSGSCAAMLRVEVPRLVAPDWREAAAGVASRTYELVDYLVQEDLVNRIQGRFPHRVMVHGSCHATRWLGQLGQLEKVVGRLADATVLAFPHPSLCCGFGGTFSVHFPQLSLAMADAKLDDIVAQEAEVIVSGDLGCLHHLAGRLLARGLDVRVMHIAELLAEATEVGAHGA